MSYKRSVEVPEEHEVNSKSSLSLTSLFGCCLPGLDKQEYTIELKDDKSDQNQLFWSESDRRLLSGRDLCFSAGSNSSPPKPVSSEKRLHRKSNLASKSPRLSRILSAAKPRKLVNRRQKAHSLTPRKKKRSGVFNSKPSIARGLGLENKKSSSSIKKATMARVNRLYNLSEDCKLPDWLPEDEISSAKGFSRLPSLTGLSEFNTASDISSEFYDVRSPVFARGLSSASSFNFLQKRGLSNIGSMDNELQYGGEEGAKPMCSLSSTPHAWDRNTSEGLIKEEDKRPIWSPISEGIPEIALFTPIKERKKQSSGSVTPMKLRGISEVKLALPNGISLPRSCSPEQISIEGKLEKRERVRSL